MKLGFIGLGKMGGSMVQRLIDGGHDVAVFDRDVKIKGSLVKQGALNAASMIDLVSQLESPRVIWIMLPAGEITGMVLEEISGMLNQNDILIDGGNSNFKDTIKRYDYLKTKGIKLLDAGTSGGIWGLQEGYCLMIGGDQESFHLAEPVFKTLAPEKGYEYIGPAGSGHFVKMIHNGIEYGLMEAYAEGFEILEKTARYDIDLAKVSRLWGHGSVVRSWLLKLLENVFTNEPDLKSIKDYVPDSGEGKWTIMHTIEENIPAPVITLSLLQRFASRQKESFAGKVLAALRNEFGGHGVIKE